jgi:hypothetical protein
MRAYDTEAEARKSQLPWKGAMFDADSVGVFLGMDVGKSAHHGHGLTPAGKKVFDKAMPNSEPKLRAVFDKLIAKFGTVLVIVDQPASIGALPFTVARDAGCKVAFLPGLAIAPDRRSLPGRGQDRRQGRRGHRGRRPHDVFNALDEQTVVVPGTGTLDIVIPSLARSLAAVHEQRHAHRGPARHYVLRRPLPAHERSHPSADYSFGPTNPPNTRQRESGGERRP